MTDYIAFEDMYFVINISFVYLGLGECFQTRQISRRFSCFQTILFIYMTVLSLYGGIGGIYMFYFVISSSGDGVYTIEDAVQILPPCFLLLLVVFTDVIIFCKKNLNKEIIRKAQDIYPKEEELDEIAKTILINKMKPVKRMIKFYTLLTNLQPFAYSIEPLYKSFVLKREYVLPFMMWYPYDVRASLRNYLLTFYTQLVASTYTAWSLAAVDCAIVVIMVNISLHLELLGHRLRNIAPENENLTAGEIDGANDKLDKIIMEHIKVINLLNKLQRMFSLIFLSKYVMTAALICQCLFSIMISSFNRKINFVLFISSTLIQMFIICWYGHEIIEKSEALCLAIYNSNWPHLDKGFKQKMLIIQARALIPLELDAMGFARISLSAFTAIAKAGWSFFSITRQMYEPPE